MPKLDFLTGSNEEFSRATSVRKLINWYPHQNLDTGSIQLYPMPGYDVFATTNGSSWKGSIEFNGAGYAVVGTTLKEILPSGTVNTVGTNIVGGQDRIDFAKGKTQVMLVDGNQGYVYTPSTATFTIISDGNFPSNPTTCAHLDGYFFVNDPSNPGRWYRSQQNDATDWTIGSVPEFATAERSGDPLRIIREAGNKMWFIGTEVAEAWFNASDPNSVLHRVNSINVDWGIDAPFTAKEVDNNLIWLAKNDRAVGKVIIVNQAGTPKIISPPWLETIITSYSIRSDAFADVIDWNGHIFYVLTFPTADATWVFDLRLQAWFTWKNYSLDRHRNNGFLRVGDRFLIGDFSNGNIYELKDTMYTDNGDIQKCLWTSDHLIKDNNSLRWNSIEPVFEAGVGLVGSGQGSDPLCQLRFSKDKGNNWSSNDRYRKMGKIGEYTKRTIYRNKGWAKYMTLEISCSEPVKKVLTDVFVDIDISTDRPFLI